jgi:hypothetical protein
MKPIDFRSTSIVENYFAVCGYPVNEETVELTTARGRSTTNQTARAGAATG